MHSALLVDEILRLIFDAVLTVDKPSLCCAARCCHAWKGPALDLIWRRLPSVVPLLSLLPGFSMEKDTIRLDQKKQDVSSATFKSYSLRVKHIVHRHRVVVDLSSIPVNLFHQLSNLESARIESRAVGEVALLMSLAPRLREVTLQVGYAKSNLVSTTIHKMISLLQGCSSLEHLFVRGYSSECLHGPLSGVRTLRSLSLHLSSLTEQSFMTVSTFAHLECFDAHADHLSHDLLWAAIARSSNSPFFPALKKLKIRAQSALVALIVQQLPRNELHSLYVDATGPAPLLAFEDLFKALGTLQLHEFTLGYAVSTEDLPTYTSDNVFTLGYLRLLSKLPLRRFILDSSLPPDLSDADIEEMVKWWPFLECLELGSHAALENTETNWKPKNSLASLSTLARGCKHLRSLVITLDVDSAHSVLDSRQGSCVFHPLTSLLISSRSRPDVPTLSMVFSRLFPSLRDVTPGFVGEHEDTWAAFQETVLKTN